MLEVRALYVLDAYFSDDWKFSKRPRIRVSRDMSNSFVPDVTISELPARFYQERMYGRPAELAIPKPERRFW